MCLQLGWEALQEAASMAGLQLRKLDKKAEKALVLEQKASLSERLSSEDDPAAALSLAVPLFVAQASFSTHFIYGEQPPKSRTKALPYSSYYVLCMRL